MAKFFSGILCSLLLDPLKADLKSGEFWCQVLARMRQLLLEAYTKCVSRFEDHMRAECERRTETGWSFNSYFMLQEELAFMFEMLGLYEDALVQYDELDALFTQFVLNHAVGASAAWIMTMLANHCSKWDGICLAQPINTDKRAAIRKNEASLLEFRNYLFSRQCTLLFLLSRPGEVAQRSIVFMHNCVQELSSLKIEMVPGAKECWIFLSCMEVLKKCELFSKHGKMEVYSLHTASLWDYARTKLHCIAEACCLLPYAEPSPHTQSVQTRDLLEGAIPTKSFRETGKSQICQLGQLCGLLPDILTQSCHLELVVELMCGLSDEREGQSEPLHKLKEALSSKTAFRKHYLELSELAMGTFKHIGRIRCARMIGKDLADFYMKVGQPQHAEGFLMDALKMFQREKWQMLADDTCLQLAQCQKLLNCQNKYVSSCQYIASSNTLPLGVRQQHQEDIHRISLDIEDAPLSLRAEPVFTVTAIDQDQDTFTPFEDSFVTVTINSNLPESILCDYIALSLIPMKICRKPNISTTSTVGRGGGATNLDMRALYEVTKEMQGTVLSSRVDCHTPLRRMDSGITETQVCKDDYTISLKADNVRLVPGGNRVTLAAKLGDSGSYSLSQLCVTVAGLDFLHMLTQHTVSLQIECQQSTISLQSVTVYHLIAICHKYLQIECQQSTISLQSVTGDVWLGLPHQLQLTIDTGSYSYTEATQLSLSATPDLQLTPSVIDLPPVGSNQTLQFAVTACAELAPVSPQEVIYDLHFACIWFRNAHQTLTFKHPFQLGHKLYTAGKRKFIQVTVTACGCQQYQLSTPSMTADVGRLEVTALNHPQQILVIGAGERACYVWRVGLTENAPESVTYTFNVNFRPDGLHLPALPYNYTFSLDHLQTLYTVETSVVPPPGMNLCSAGSPCDLLVDVQQLTTIDHTNRLFYQVRSDNYWAVCDSTATGMCKLEMNQFRTHVCIRPLLGGYLPLPSVHLHRSSTPETSGETGVHSQGDVSFSVGQVYNRSGATQVHVLPAATDSLQVTVAT
ncbi:Trafficking protein particle complex subunit 10 [Lamellibrachia satsuma]|nr:Trafficking protein particle complex subunit 10 [Lamellibrachia satsuma]